MSLLKDKFTLTIVGDGIDRNFLENACKKLNLEKEIKFIGWINQEDLPRIYNNHHLFISMSDYETFGITYIEALACRLPCIVYDYPVSREIIPNEMAIFINNLNPKDWAKKLIKIQKNPMIYNTIINNINKNYHKLYKYHEEQSTEKLITVYKKILIDKINKKI